MAVPTAPVIIVKKKVGHGGAHHGGAWKVAYADFVTAMMALFIVLWLLNTSAKVRNEIAGYFKDPKGHDKKMGTKLAGLGEALPLKKDDMSSLKEKLESAMKKMQDFTKIHQQVQITITQEGLRIELIETKGGFFFQNGSPTVTKEGAEILTALAEEIGKIPNHLLIEGHTDSVPYAPNVTYSNWELSADRANSARRLMENNGLHPEQVSYVRGYADRQLRKPDNPLDPANRRVSLVVQYLDVPDTGSDKPALASNDKAAMEKLGQTAGKTPEPAQPKSAVEPPKGTPEKPKPSPGKPTAAEIAAQ
jgi:chemotaxis protein MotB